MKKLILRFNANPPTTLERLVALANSVGVLIESIEDERRSRSITHKTVTIQVSEDVLSSLRDGLTRIPAITVKGEQGIGQTKISRSVP